MATRNDQPRPDSLVAAKLAAEQRRRWTAGQAIALEELLREFNDPVLSTEDLASLAFAEYQLRSSRGETPVLDEFTARFPTCSDALTQLVTPGSPDPEATIVESDPAVETTQSDLPEMPPTVVEHPTMSEDPSASEYEATLLDELSVTADPTADGTAGESAPTTDSSEGEDDFEGETLDDIGPLNMPERRAPRFALGPEIGRGGMGQILNAHDDRIRRDVAYKKLLRRAAQSKEARSRFVEEAQITGQLEHSGVVPIYEMGTTEDGSPYYVMKLIRGETLEDAISSWREMDPGDPQHRVVFRSLLNRFIDICNTLAFAHDHGVIHRDLKPQNVMLGEYGETLVLDWGLAKVLSEQAGMDTSLDGTELPDTEPLDSVAEDSDSDVGATLPLSSTSVSESHLSATASDSQIARTVTTDERMTQTRHGSILGTPAYMSPEQAHGRHATLDNRTDVYALGAILYRLLTGESPTGRFSTVRKAVKAVRAGNIKPPRSIDGHVPRPLEAVCLKALKLNRDERYATATELKNDVEAWLDDEPVSAYPEPLPVRTWRWVKRHRIAVAVTAAIAFTAVVVPFTVETMRHIEVVTAVEELIEQADEAEAAGHLESAQSLLAQAEGLVSNEPALDDIAREVSERRRDLESTLRNQAVAARDHAVQQSLLAEARRLVAESRSAQIDKPRLSLLLAARAVNLSRDTGQTPVPAAVQNLHDVIGRFGGAGHLQHSGPIQSLAMSSDGRWLISGSSDHRARLWRADRWMESVELFGHEGPVTAVLLTPDGRYAVTAGDDGAVALWDVLLDAQPDPVHVLIGHTQPVTCLAVSSDGRWLASAGLDTEVRIWDLADEDPESRVRRLVGHSDTVNVLRFSPDGSMLFSGSDDRVIAAWSIPVEDDRPDPTRLMNGHDAGITTLDVSADGTWLVSGDSDGEVNAWQTTSSDTPQSLATGRFAITGIQFSPEELAFAAATANGHCLVWNIVDGECQQAADLEQHDAAINDLLWLTSPLRLVTASDDRTLSIQNWPLDDDESTTLRIHEDGVSALAASGDGRVLVGGGFDGTVQLWDASRTAPGLTPDIVNAHDRQIQQLAVSPDGRRVISISSDRDQPLRLWQHTRERLHSSEEAASEIEQFGRATRAAWHPRRPLVAVGNHDGDVLLIDLEGLSPPRTLSGLTESVSDMAFSPDGSMLAAGAEEGQLAIWSVSQSQDAEALQPPATEDDLTSVAWAPATSSEDDINSVLVFGTDTGGVYLAAQNPAKNGAVAILQPGSHERAVNQVAVSPDGRWVASVSDDKTLRLWDQQPADENAASVKILLRHLESVYALQFTPDSAHIVTVSEDGTAIVWPVDSESPEDDARVLEGHAKGIRSVTLADDGRTVLTGSDDGTVRSWDLTLDNPSAASVLIRNFGESIRSLAAAPDSATVFVGTRSGRIAAWPLEITTLLDAATATAGRNLSDSEALQFEPDLSQFELPTGPED